ncbi:lantibiotic dehydratase [Kitasatospora aureofaciens]|uniref:lantibiotic dehydratase n=1 Tax=Kitasatospora aureofaciens TaxID=1894 RepID=UPI0036F453C8
MTPLGPSVLLRTGGFPVRLWLAAGSPGLFRMLGSLNSLHEEYRRLGRTLAARIGTEFVPHPSPSAQERRLALDLRRRLHNGTPVAAADCSQLATLVASLAGAAAIATELARAADLSAEIRRLEEQTREAIAVERSRILCAPWALLHASPAGRRALSDGSLAAAGDVRRRLATGESWHGKRLRRRSDQLWEAIARGATTATPRSWFGHVTLVPVNGRGSDSPLRLSVTGEFAAEWTENVHTLRRELVEGVEDGTDRDAYVGFTALHRSDGEHVRVWAVDPRNPNRVTRLCVRHTPLLGAIQASLRQGTRPLHELEADVLPEQSTARQREVLRAFVAHLVELGVLQLSRPPRRRHTGWQALGPAVEPTVVGTVPSPPVQGGGTGFLDVYRRAAQTVAVADCRDLQRSIEQARRVFALIEADGPSTDRPLLDRVDADPRPVLDVFAEWVEATKAEDEARTGWNVGWPPARTPGSGYQRLLDQLASAADTGVTVDLTPALLDALGAPQREPSWPLDCLLRPLATGKGAVLEAVAPAGVLDARFVGALQRLHGRMPHVAAYRGFLERIERQTGTPFVEILVPPLSDLAANAVRRPGYTRFWTGDPDLRTYCEPAEPPPEFVPLAALTVRRSGDRLLIEAGGRPIRPVYHATRMPPPPWDQLVRLLLHGSPQRACWDPNIKHTLGALPGRAFVPRVTVGNALVLAAAQWRLRPDQLWDAAASELEKVRTLRRLRDTLGLPRWVLVAHRPGEVSNPCDLESLRAVGLLEHGLAATDAEAGMVFEEMVPAPDEFLAVDHAGPAGDRVAAELMLRLPCDEGPQAMAARLAADRTGTGAGAGAGAETVPTPGSGGGTCGRGPARCQERR